MKVHVLVVGGYEVNCYILSSDGENAIIIDPGFEYETISTYLQEQHLTPRLIINTHGHADHIGTNSRWNLPIWIHSEDASFLENPDLNLSSLFSQSVISPPPTRLLTHGELLDVHGIKAAVLHTPGHTPGSISLLSDDVLFSGDTLFRGSVGRTDFPNGDGRLIISSIKNHLMSLDDAVTVYPGHGEKTTIGFEREHNYFLR